jgi:SAM-dependent methyltransferase
MSQVSLPGYKPLDFPPVSVETTVPAEALAKMLQRTEAIFTANSRERPHWTVLTAPRFEPDQFEAHREQFFRSGLEAVHVFRAFAARAGIDLSGYRTCFELGCGVGRITVALAALFDRVIGADIAKPMLEEAARTASGFKVTNIEWMLTNRFAIYDELETFDVFFTGIVLQHNPPPVMAYMLTRLLGKLRPGGIGFFQLPTYRLGYSFSAEEYLKKAPSNDIEMHVFPQRPLLELVQRCGCRILEIREDGATGETYSQISNTLLVEKD